MELLYTILGAGGSIGNALADELLAQNKKVKLVSRKGAKVKGAESVAADILNYDELVKSVKNSSVIFLTVGLQYGYKVWSESWVKIIKNTIKAAKEVNAKLVFFDNVYMYGKVDGKMTESTPYNPCSKKGKIRAEVAKLIEEEFTKGELKSLIARAADLYGIYGGNNCIPNFMIIENLLKGKNAQCLANINTLHSYTYIPDCAKSLILLADDENAFNQVWHLPTFNPPITSRQFIDLTAKILNTNAKTTILKSWMVKLLGYFVKPINEVYEMLYQAEYDYYFDSTKFNKTYNFYPTSYEVGITETIGWIKNNKN